MKSPLSSKGDKPREVYLCLGLYFPKKELAEKYLDAYTWHTDADTQIYKFIEVNKK